MARLAPDRRARFETALRGEQERRAGTYQRSDEQPGPEDPDVLPVDRASVGGPTWPFDDWDLLLGPLGPSSTNLGVGGGLALGLGASTGSW
jgi:hypothetical protein